MNHHLIRYFQERPKKVDFTRSRPYRKNDNAYVEQKNYTHVRHLLGWNRLIQSQHISEETKDQLRLKRDSLNPMKLKNLLEQKLRKVFAHQKIFLAKKANSLY